MRVKLLNKNDLEKTKCLDELSGICVSEKLMHFAKDEEDTRNSIYGLFDKEDLIGYCSLSYAKGIIFKAESNKQIGEDDLYLNDVFIKKNYRHLGFGSRMILGAIKNKSYKGISVYLNIIRPSLKNFYNNMGFEMIIDKSGLMKKDI